MLIMNYAGNKKYLSLSFWPRNNEKQTSPVNLSIPEKKMCKQEVKYIMPNKERRKIENEKHEACTKKF